MTPITLESIKADADALAAKIATFEAQSVALEAVYHFPEVTIQLAPGEHYAGLVIGKDGAPSYHLVLLPGQADDITWQDAIKWAQDHGGEYVASLPNRREQSLLFSNLKEEFEGRGYWSSESYASDPAYAWFQVFSYGSQGDNRKDGELRARAVRRLIIE